MMVTLAAIAAATLILYGPGLAVAAAARLRGLAALALAPAFTLAAVGGGTILAPVAGLGWGWGAAVASTLLAVGLAAAVGRLFPMVAPRALPRWTPRQWRVVALAGFAAFAIGAGSLLIGYGGDLGHPGQRHDIPFHGNLVRAILDTGDASPFHAGLLDHPGASSAYYPSAVHALVALLPAPLQVWPALNATFLVGTVGVWSVSVAYLARVLVPARPGFTITALALSAAFQATPSTLVYLIPNAVGTALLPALLGWSVQLARVVTIRSPGRVGRVLVLAVALGGAGLAHPGTGFSYLVVAWPVAAYIARVATVRAWRRGHRLSLIAVWVALAAGAGLATYAVASLPSLHATFAFAGWETPLNPALAAGAALADVTSHVLWFPNVGVGLAVLVGLGVVLRSGRRRWLLGAWALAVLLTIIAASAWPPLAWLTGPWYGERQRLGTLITIIAIPLATLGIEALAAYVRRPAPDGDRHSPRQRSAGQAAGQVAADGEGRPRWRRRGLGMAGSVRRVAGDDQGRPTWRRWVALAAAVAAAGNCLVLMSARPARLAGQGLRLESSPAHPRLVNEEEWAMMLRLRSELVPDGVVLGNPANGSVLLPATIGQPVVFAHLSGTWDENRHLLLTRLADAPADPALCQALTDLGVRYLYTDPVTYYNLPTFAALDQAIAALPPTWLRHIDTGGGATVWELTGCR
jgi:hypothetical protein